jgi:eukaryotic-like serine/threonine-protein kinase
MNEPEIFAAAIKLSGDARHAFLDAACGQDAQQREQIEALLKAHEESGGLLPKQSDPRLDQTHVVLRQAEPGVVIAGRYKLLEQIGEGGMGTVWVAEQSQPVKRKVALKLIKAGMDSRSVLARFEAERQALALMDHPNIAKVLDGGLTETGRPYFVMDYVKGVPITEYCDITRLSVPDRLQLFVQVCQAVQHAHQKGIIHRDLKPSNILVAPYDDKPVPKVIDFGLAKAMNQSLTEKTLHTAHDMVLGTPQYMSPEQATFNNLDIDTRSDVYSLGTLLYELLAGSPPFAQPELEKRGLLEILRVVREEEPQRPSLKLSTAEARARISANRSSEPAQLSTMMQGEIDWIVMKALEKDRTRRYDTATALAKDVQRYLNGDAVEACPPTLAYRLRNAYRRNKTAVVVASAFLGLLLGAVAMGAVLAMQAKRAELVALKNEQEAEEQREEAEQSKDA